ncbi:unnamed protein product [Sphacelaria rigidula]
MPFLQLLSNFVTSCTPAPLPPAWGGWGRRGREKFINHPLKISVTPHVSDRWLPPGDRTEGNRTSLKHQRKPPHQPACAPTLWCTPAASQCPADKSPTDVYQMENKK